MSIYGLRESDQYQEWVSANSSNLETEFLKKTAPEDMPLDDDMPDWFADNDDFHDYCDKQFNEAN